MDKHHIISKKYGGSNKKNNIAKICQNCHRDVHMGLLIIEGWVQSTSGMILIFRKKGEPSITGNPDPKVWLY